MMLRAPRSIAGAASAIALLVLPLSGWAHAVVQPARSAPAAYERYVLRVPNEREAPTLKVSITFPSDVKVISFADVPGWTVEIARGRDGGITGAAWTGRLGAERFVEFPFIALNPQTEATLSWPVTQEHEGGESVAWAGPEGSDAPASTTRIDEAEGETNISTALYLGAAGVLLGMIALGVALRKPDQPAARRG